MRQVYSTNLPALHSPSVKDPPDSAPLMPRPRLPVMGERHQHTVEFEVLLPTAPFLVHFELKLRLTENLGYSADFEMVNGVRNAIVWADCDASK